MNSRALIVAAVRSEQHVPGYLVHLLSQAGALCARVILVVGPRSADVLPPLRKLGVQTVVAPSGDSTHVLHAAGIAALVDDRSITNIVLCDDSFIALNPAQLLGRTPADAPVTALASLTMIRTPNVVLQSFWLSFMGRHSIESPAFQQWWRQPGDPSEIDLTRHFLGAGYKVGALFNQDRSEQVISLCRAYACGALPLPEPKTDALPIDPGLAQGLDPTQFAWDRLMADHGFISLRLLEENPQRVNVVKLRKWMTETPGVRDLLAAAVLR